MPQVHYCGSNDHQLFINLHEPKSAVTVVGVAAGPLACVGVVAGHNTGVGVALIESP